MVDIIKQDMTDIWATSGDVVAPDPAKIRAGWGVEAVPRQWWNWFENRQDTNIAYMLQKGIPEWDQFTEYLTNKSYVQRNSIVYKCISTGIGADPATAPGSWVKAFPESSAYLETIRPLTVVSNSIAYIDGSGAAANTPSTAYGRSLLNAGNALASRVLTDSQQANTNLTALSGVVAATNALPYFTGTSTMGTTVLSAFGRSLIDDVDAAAARVTLGVISEAEVANNLAVGLTTKQPLDATLTALAGVAATVNKLPYFNGTDSAAVTDLTAFGRSLLDDGDAATARATLGVSSAADTANNLAAGLATKQPLASTLTALAALSATTNKLPYFNGTNTAATADLTAFGRSLIAAQDAAAARDVIGVSTSNFVQKTGDTMIGLLVAPAYRVTASTNPSIEFSYGAGVGRMLYEASSGDLVLATTNAFGAVTGAQASFDLNGDFRPFGRLVADRWIPRTGSACFVDAALGVSNLVEVAGGAPSVSLASPTGVQYAAFVADATNAYIYTGGLTRLNIGASGLGVTGAISATSYIQATGTVSSGGDVVANGDLLAARHVYAGGGAATLFSDGGISGPYWGGTLANWITVNFLQPYQAPAYVAAANAAAPVGAVGAYVMLRRIDLAASNPGDVVSGGVLGYSSAAGLGSVALGFGNWRCMGINGSTGGVINTVTLWLRIS